MDLIAKLTPQEQIELQKSLKPLPIEVVKDAALLTQYERKAIVSRYPHHRQPRESLLDFTMATNHIYKPEAFHSYLCDHLDAIVRGDIRRLMVFAPPQHGKSELSSVRFPAYWLGRRPNDPVIIASYGASLALDKSKQVREIVRSPEYQEIFPNIELRADSQAADLWHLANGYHGSLLAAGVDGPVTGHGGLLGVIDDPLSGWKAAQSETVRASIWEWYRGTFRTRLWEGAALLLIMTRWHEQDLAGMILNSPGADEWTVIRMPALAESQKERDRNNRRSGLPEGLPDPLGRRPGEPLTPLRFSIATMKEMKRDVGPMAWNAEYQGSPRPAEGNIIKRSWFKIISQDDLPKGEAYVMGAAERQGLRSFGGGSSGNLHYVRYWDKAGSDEKDSDYTVGLLMMYDDRTHTYYVLDVVRGQWTVFPRNELIMNTAIADEKKYGKGAVHIYHEQEPGSSGKDTAAIINKMLRMFPVYAETVTGSKEVRAQPFIAAAAGSNVKLLFADWNDDYLDELCDFPNGGHDDQVDASSGAYNKLALFQPTKQLVAY